MICQCRLIPAPKYSRTNPLSGWHRSGGKTIPVSGLAVPVLASAMPVYEYMRSNKRCAASHRAA